MEVKKILIPVDGSEFSKKAAQYGIDLAKMCGASIILLHSHKAVPPTLGSPNREQFRDKLVSESEVVFQPYVKMLEASGLEFESKILGGPTAEVIFDAATAGKADMIVMGSRGKSELAGLLVGSVTHKLLHIAPCPVLVVR